MHIGARGRPPPKKRAMLQYRYGKAPVDGTLFGHRASVMHCLTWAEFQQALARGLLVMMWSVYVDDSNIVDFRTAKGSGTFGRRGFQLLGTPFSPPPKKVQTLSTSPGGGH